MVFELQPCLCMIQHFVASQFVVKIVVFPSDLESVEESEEQDRKAGSTKKPAYSHKEVSSLCHIYVVKFHESKTHKIDFQYRVVNHHAVQLCSIL